MHIYRWGGHGNPLLYSCLENPTERGTWQATVHGITKSLRRLSDWTHRHIYTYRHRYIYIPVSQVSCTVVCNSLWPHGLQHTRPPCPSPTYKVYPKSCPLSRWCHPAISSSIVPFSSHLQSFPTSGSFQMSQFFASGGQSIGVSSSASVLPMNIQDWFPFRWTGLITLQSKGLLRVFSNTKGQKHQFFDT